MLQAAAQRERPPRLRWVPSNRTPPQDAAVLHPKTHAVVLLRRRRAQIYTLALEHLHLEPSQVVFFDDSARNIQVRRRPQRGGKGGVGAPHASGSSGKPRAWHSARGWQATRAERCCTSPLADAPSSASSCVQAAHELGLVTAVVGRDTPVPGADYVLPTMHHLPSVMPELLLQSSGSAPAAAGAAAPAALVKQHVEHAVEGPDGELVPAHLVAVAQGSGAGRGRV